MHVRGCTSSSEWSIYDSIALNVELKILGISAPPACHGILTRETNYHIRFSNTSLKQLGHVRKKTIPFLDNNNLPLSLLSSMRRFQTILFSEKNEEDTYTSVQNDKNNLFILLPLILKPSHRHRTAVLTHRKKSQKSQEVLKDKPNKNNKDNNYKHSKALLRICNCNNVR